MFVAFGLSGLIPAVHYILKDGSDVAFNRGALGWLILMAVLYISGAVLYAVRIPERFFPGKCDIWVIFFFYFVKKPQQSLTV
jgi:adiponectin receptor